MATTPVNPGNGAGEGTGPTAGSPTQHSSAGNGGYITAEELERRLAEARRDEKAKLYPEIDRLKADLQKKERDLADLRTSLESAQEGSRRAQSLEEQIARLEKQISSTTDQFSKAIDDALENQRRQFEEARNRDRLEARKEALLSTVRIKVKQKDAQGNEVEVDDYEVIPEMVTGNTPEELQANFEKARQRYQAIRDRGAAVTRQELGGPLREALPKPVTPGSESGSTASGNVEGGLDAWREMSPQEWEQKRRAIKQKIFADAGLPMKQR